MKAVARRLRDQRTNDPGPTSEANSCAQGMVWLSPAYGTSVPSAVSPCVDIGGQGPSENAPAWATVSLIDYFCSRVRFAIIGVRAL